jgi:hypothetical protein
VTFDFFSSAVRRRVRQPHPAARSADPVLQDVPEVAVRGQEVAGVAPRAGIDFMRLHFGRKLLRANFHPQITDEYPSRKQEPILRLLNLG